MGARARGRQGDRAAGPAHGQDRPARGQKERPHDETGGRLPRAELPEADYVAFLAREAAEASATGQEELILSKKDRAAVGAKAVKAANELLAKKRPDAVLTLSAETRELAGGLILKQGDIEVNCSVDTLLELSRGELAARVAEVLFEG